MKEIVIKESNAEKIMTALNVIQGRATERIFYSYYQIESICSDVEKRLKIIPSRGFKKAVEGTEFVYDFRQHFPNCYRWTPYSSWIRCRYHKGTWRLVSLGRDICPNKFGYPYELRLSETAKEAVLKEYE